MADDVHEQVFNEKQFYTGDTVGEDGEVPGLSGVDLPRIVPDGIVLPRSAAVALREHSSSDCGATRKQPMLPSAKALPVNGQRDRRRKRAAERAMKITCWLESKYDVLPEVCSSLENWQEAPSASSDFDLLWCDTVISADRFMKLKLYQKMNHFVGMSAITRKNNLGRNLLRMRKQYPKEYSFFPDTWILPTDLSDFKQQFSGKSKTFIIKPDNSCQGKGIFLVRDVEKVPVDLSTTYVAQRYLHKPFLLDGFKFDLRLYILVAGCDPLRVFLHRRGLVRLASEQYIEPTGKNLQHTMVHLTNYAINKFNPNFEENTNPEDARDGHKRSWEAVQVFLRKEGHDVDALNAEIEDLIIKTLIAVQPSLSHFYHSCQPEDVENSMCFEILGFDVMLDHKLQPWLLEVNHAPSFATESELDRVVKTEVLRDTFGLLNMDPETRRQKKRVAREKFEMRAMGVSKKASAEERMMLELDVARDRTAWEDNNLGSYKRLYPSAEKEQAYLHIHDAAINIWEMLMGGTSRRTIRLSNPVSEEESRDLTEKTSNRKTSKGDGAEGIAKKEKRTPEQLKEVLERLMNGCSARPRLGETHGQRQETRAGEKDSCPNGVEQEETKDLALGSGKPPRPDVQVGDVIKVQTNLGWESVTVRAKRTNGKVDIQFKDGEYMRSVLPRILRQHTSVASSSAGVGAPTSEVPSLTVGGIIAGDLGLTLPPNSTGPQAVMQLPPPLPQSGAAAAMVASHSVPVREKSSSSSPSSSGIVVAASSSVGTSNTTSFGCSSRSPAVLVSAREEPIRITMSTENQVTPKSSLPEAYSDSHFAAQQRVRRYRASQPGVGAADVPPPLASVVGAVGAGARAVSAFRTGNVGVFAWPAPGQEPARNHEVRLRHQLQQLINVRPIVTRRPSGVAEDKP